MLPKPIHVELKHHGAEVVAACVHLRSSDFGAGPLELSFELLRVICENGLIGRSALRQVHLGGKLPDELGISSETYRLDSETQASAIRDITGKLLTEDYVHDQVAHMRQAAVELIDPQRAVAGLVRAKQITRSQGEDVERVILRGDEAEIPSGPSTRWKLAQAVSWIAKEHGDRRYELERLAGTMILERVN